MPEKKQNKVWYRFIDRNRVYDYKSIYNAIHWAEIKVRTSTSGEIRVHIDSKCTGEVMDRAFEVFKKLKIHETGLRNGVLFYLAEKWFPILVFPIHKGDW